MPTFKLVRKSNSPNWFISFTDNGQTQRAPTWTEDKKKAEIELSRFVAGYEQQVAPDEPTIREILEGYLLAPRPRKLSDGSVYGAQALTTRVGDLFPAHFRQEAAKRYADERGAADGTIIKELGVLNAAMGWAEREDWIKQAPQFLMPVATPRSKDRWLTKEEARRLLNATTLPHLRMFVMLGIYTAARKGAILDLTWDQVSDKVIDFGEGTGNKRRSKVPIAWPLRVELDAQRAVATSPFCVEYQGRKVTHIHTAWKTLVRNADLPGVTPHTMRHTAATWQIMDGIPLPQVARFLGDSERMVERVYGHHSPDYLKDAVESLAF
jgi:integrase